MSDESGSEFSNRGPEAAAGADDYVRLCLELLGDRDPFAVQEATVDELRRLTAGLSRQELTRREAPGKWSILQVVCHLADTEIVYGYRMRLILAEDDPDVPAYDQDLWAENLGYQESDLGTALDELEAGRDSTLRLLRRLDEGQWRRKGRHAERGLESVRHIFRLLAAHDLIHLRQIRRIRLAHGLG